MISGGNPRAPRGALIFIVITVAIDAIGIGVIVPVLPQLFIDLTGADLAHAAIYGGWLTALFGAAQFFATPVLGNLSDRYGRRPVLLISLLAFAVDYVVCGFAPTITWLFVTRFLAGIFGATYSIANAYIADVSDPSDRSRHFGLLGAAFGLGFIIGPSLGGVLGEYGPRVPFFAAGAIALLNALYGLLILPESLPTEHRRPFSLRRANPFGAFVQMRAYRSMLGVFGAMFLMQVAGMTLPATWPFYTMLKLDWSARDVGYSLAAYGILSIIVQGGMIGWVTRTIGERRAIFLGLASSVIGYLGFAFADRSWTMLACILPTGIGYLAGPALVSAMANQVPKNAQGELQGALASSYSVIAVFTPLLMTQIFSYFSSDQAAIHFPGMPYLLAAILAGASLLWLVQILGRVRLGPESTIR